MTEPLRERAARIIAPKPFRRLDTGSVLKQSDAQKMATAYKRADRLIDAIYRDAAATIVQAMQAKIGRQIEWPMA